MNPIVYNIANLLGWLLVSTGAIRHYGLDSGLMVSGWVLLLLNFIGLFVVLRGK